MAFRLPDKVVSIYEELLNCYRQASSTTIAFTTITLASIITLSRLAYRDYKMYMSYGPGGVPHNVFGWLAVTLVIRPMSKEVLSTDVYRGQEDMGSWLPDGELRRKGERPAIGPHPIPQRQLTRMPKKEIQQKLVAAFDDLAKASQDLVKVALSKFERRTEAIFLADSIQKSPFQPIREISHIHSTGDHSVHVILSPSDCQKVIKGGWGQRHPLSGSKPFKTLTGVALPSEYLFIYAPRDEEELETLMVIVRAAVGFMSGSHTVK